MFQLGHDFSAMEIIFEMMYSGNAEDVSIGPRLFSHGDGGHFSPSTDIEKLAIFERYAN